MFPTGSGRSPRRPTRIRSPRSSSVAATLEQAREFLIHRSAYQLKEADPHSWVIPRLVGAAKTAVMEIQYDEYGSGDPAWMHAELFRNTMVAAGSRRVVRRLPRTAPGVDPGDRAT